MSFEEQSITHTSDQFRGNMSLASSTRFESRGPTAGGLTAADQGTSQVSISQLNDSDHSVEVGLAKDPPTNALHHRHGYGVEEEKRDPGPFTPNGSVGSPKMDETASVDTDWSESTIVPRRNLGFIQITSLMLNGTIGSGPFITPGYVLLLTRSKPIALALWALGGVYTALRYFVWGFKKI